MNRFSSAIQKIEEVGKRHKQKEGASNLENWFEAIERYSKLKKSSIIDLIIDATNLYITFNSQEVSYIDPLVKKAISETNPNFDFINPPSGDQLKGAINSAKGKYFEYLVVDKLNNGERVGDLILPEGYIATVAEKFNQPGWDIQILDPNGDTSNFIQLKATDSLSYIKNALDRYPDIQILTTDEVGDFVADGMHVFDSDLSNEWLEYQVESSLINNEGFGEVFFENFSPLFSLAFIAASEGYQVAFSEKNIENSFSSTVNRFSKSIASQGVSALLAACGNPAAIPAGILTRYVLERMEIYEHLSEIIIKSRVEMVKLRLLQQDLTLHSVID